MSEFLTPSEDDDQLRRRAAWGLGVLVLVAVIFVTILILVLGSSPAKKPRAKLPEPPPTPTSAVPTSAVPSTATSLSTSAPDISSSAVPGSTPAACRGTAACIVDGDPGGAIPAINQLRTSHGLPAAAGSVTAGAQQCALQQGSSTSCVPHYAWQPVPTPNGALVVSKIDQQWLLDPKMTSFHVGWAYVPGSPGQWGFAVLKLP